MNNRNTNEIPEEEGEYEGDEGENYDDRENDNPEIIVLGSEVTEDKAIAIGEQYSSNKDIYWIRLENNNGKTELRLLQYNLQYNKGHNLSSSTTWLEGTETISLTENQNEQEVATQLLPQDTDLANKQVSYYANDSAIPPHLLTQQLYFLAPDSFENTNKRGGFSFSPTLSSTGHYSPRSTKNFYCGIGVIGFFSGGGAGAMYGIATGATTLATLLPPILIGAAAGTAAALLLAFIIKRCFCLRHRQVRECLLEESQNSQLRRRSSSTLNSE